MVFAGSGSREMKRMDTQHCVTTTSYLQSRSGEKGRGRGRRSIPDGRARGGTFISWALSGPDDRNRLRLLTPLLVF